ncbi:hypothetical protein CRUP_010093 [Coryphaenoides rupestris]|nr:hypothetical protein CRUP_010093 [Coryphaenoides rupestris]
MTGLGVICRHYQSFSSWSGLIAHLKASVKVKRRRVHIKSHGDCFVGSDAVDVLADHLPHALLDCNVFESVGTKVFGTDKNQNVFLDCKNTLYRQEELRLPSMVNEVWQEQTTVRLLKLVDLPLLDGVLQCLNQGAHSSGAHPLAHGNPDLIYSDHHLDRHILQAFRDSQEELRRLLTFISLAADPQAIRLDKEIPGALHKAVSDQLASIVHGKPPDVTATTFCQQVYRGSAHSKDNTDKELRALLSDIHLDPKISDKKKKNLFRQFYQSHPEVFDRYFGDSALSML